MTTKYPNSQDVFRPYLDGFDDMLGEDLEDMFEAILQVQTELGLKPSGEFGTIRSRLFANGNLSDKLAYWQRLEWDRKTFPSNYFNLAENQGGVARFIWRGDIMKGRDTAFGEDVPGVFVCLDDVLTNTASPWRIAISRITDSDVQFVAEDVGGSAITTSANSNINILVWNLYTGGEQT